MTYRETHEYVEEPVVVQDDHVTRTAVTYGPGPLGMVERLIIWIFGLIQLLIVLRVVLLLFAARESNDLVAFIYNVSDVFVAPFRGVLGINQIEAGRTELDVAAIVALVGWTVLELIIIGLIRIFRPARSA